MPDEETAGASTSNALHPSNEESMEYNMDDEDLELQKALQASLVGDSGIPEDYSHVASSSSRPIPAPLFGAPSISSFAHSTLHSGGGMSEDGEHQNNPVQTSAARANALLERTKAEQAAQLRALQQMSASSSRGTSASVSRSESATGRRRGDDAEEEEMRRAIAESLKAAGQNPEVEEDEDDVGFSFFLSHTFLEKRLLTSDQYVPDDDDEDYVPPSRSTRNTQAQRPPTLPPLSTTSQPAVDRGLSRVVDDEDAQLQAALKASMEGLPEGFRPISPPSPELIHTTELSRRMEREAAEREAALRAGKARKPQGDEDEDEDEDEEEEEDTGGNRAAATVEESVDVDEMRRRRLARFGIS